MKKQLHQLEQWFRDRGMNIGLELMDQAEKLLVESSGAGEDIYYPHTLRNWFAFWARDRGSDLFGACWSGSDDELEQAWDTPPNSLTERQWDSLGGRHACAGEPCECHECGWTGPLHDTVRGYACPICPGDETVWFDLYARPEPLPEPEQPAPLLLTCADHR